jgi:ribose 5-phosphate isomerase B
MIKIAIASDHAGFELKNRLISYLLDKGFEVKDFGSYTSESVDYPDYAHSLAQAVENGTYKFGISICGSGNGINMTVNKHQGIRSALCWNKEIAALARQHNDANICALPARFITFEEARDMVDIFLSTAFDGGRHETRIKKIPCS